MKGCLFFLVIFLHSLRIHAFEYPMLPNATLQSQTTNGPIASVLDSLLEKALLNVCVVRVEKPNLIMGYGAGFFISPYGYLITNKHVVEHGSHLTIFLGFSNDWVKASVIARHPTEDVALCKIDDVDNLHFPYFEISSIPGEIGDWVFSPRVKGMCSESNHLLIFPSLGKIVGEIVDPSFSIVSMSVVFGNSGSPILNLEGKVVGILTRQPTTESNPDENIGAVLMIPIHGFQDWINDSTLRSTLRSHSNSL